MPRVRLTATFVRNATCPSDQRKGNYFDTQLPGFLLEVRMTGGKTYYQRYRTSHGEERQLKIGSAAVLSVSQARRKARHIAAAAALGSDPHAERRALRAVPTYAQFIHDSYLPAVKVRKRSWKTDETVLRIHILPRLGALHLDEVKPTAVSELLGSLHERGYASGTRNRVLILIRYTFNLAQEWQIPGAGTNPARGLSLAPEVLRERYLTEGEITALLQALEADINEAAAKAIKLLLLTGARRNEITHARWDQIDWDRRKLLVPISKTGKPRWVRLNHEAMKVLSTIKRQDANPFLFATPTTGKPPPSLFFPWKRIRTRAGLHHVRLHDLRHSFASLLVNKRVPLYEVQKLLGHSNSRTTQRYAHLADETLDDAAEVVGRTVSNLWSGN